MTTASKYIINITNLPSPNEAIELNLDKAELQALADECAVLACKNLKTRFRARRWRKHGVIISGEFSVDIDQECIKTLELVHSHLREAFERQFLPNGSTDYQEPEIIDGEMVLDPEAADIPDVLETNEINLWDLLVEEMILTIDPFPKSQSTDEIHLEAAQSDVSEEKEPTHRPFSDLKALISEKKTNK